MTKLLRLQEILAGIYLDTQEDNNKMKAVIELIEENLGDGNQIVIWARFRKSIFMLCSMAEKMKIPYSVMYGDTKDRKEQIDRFQKHESKLFIGQIQTGGLGITITAGNIVIIYENNFSLQDRKQFEDRVHRPGQDKKCVYIDLIYKNTIDEKIMEAISKKQKMSHYLVNSFLEGDYKI